MAKRPQRNRRARKSQSAFIGKKVALDIVDMAAGGRGLGFFRDKAVFVPYTIPGEAIQAEITGERRGALFAAGLRFQALSADRAQPRCPHFGPGGCWSCQWQHIEYPAQLLLKQDVLADQLSRLGKLPDALIADVLSPLLPAPQQWQYNQALRLEQTDAGDWGMRRETQGFESISECHLAHPALISALAELDLRYPQARSLMLRRGSDGRIMLILTLGAEALPALKTDFPVSVNLLSPQRVPINLIGDAHSIFHIGESVIRATAGAFMRPNIGGLERLTAAVARALELDGGQRLLDVYAGVGIFSAMAARQAALITLVDSYPPAANDAEANLSEFDNIDIIEGAAEAALPAIARQSAQYDCAILDPPRAGLSPEVINCLKQLSVGRVVYISDRPAALARDSRALIDAGYTLSEIQPLDLAPQTWLSSAVARFER